MVVDETNLTDKKIRGLVEAAAAAGARFEMKAFTTSWRECWDRNAARTGAARVPDAAMYEMRTWSGAGTWPSCRAEAAELHSRPDMLCRFPETRTVLDMGLLAGPRIETEATMTKKTFEIGCGCSLELIEQLGGQHRESCEANYAPEPSYLLGPERRVDGAAVRYATTLNLSVSWCDVTNACGHVAISRQWPKIRLLALAMQDAGTWYWWLDTYPEDMTADAGNLTPVSSGYARSAPEAIVLIERDVEETLMKLLGTLVS